MIMDMCPRKPGDHVWALTVSHKQRLVTNQTVHELIHERYLQGPQGKGAWTDAEHQVNRQCFWLVKGHHIVGCTAE